VIEQRDKTAAEAALWRVALHEADHAAVACALGVGVLSVDVLPFDVCGASACVRTLPPSWGRGGARSRWRRALLVMLAGPVGSALRNGSAEAMRAARSDLDRAEEMVNWLRRWSPRVTLKRAIRETHEILRRSVVRETSIRIAEALCENPSRLWGYEALAIHRRVRRAVRNQGRES
jgi:hypothetical protein